MVLDRPEPADDWKLPKDFYKPQEKLLPLDSAELRLVDWIICGAAHILPDSGMNELMEWHAFREKVWFGLYRTLMEKQQIHDLPITDTEAKIVLALCPTTFRWSTGPDTGLTLKLKLSMLLRGEKVSLEEKKEEPKAKPASAPATPPAPNTPAYPSDDYT